MWTQEETLCLAVLTDSTRWGGATRYAVSREHGVPTLGDGDGDESVALRSRGPKCL